MYSFREVLKIKREKKGLSMEGLSKRAGLEKGAVKNIEYGRSIHPRIDTVEKLAGALECAPIELLPPYWLVAEELDYKALGEAIYEILKSKAVLQGKEPILTTEECIATAVMYNKIIRLRSKPSAEITSLNDNN